MSRKKYLSVNNANIIHNSQRWKQPRCLFCTRSQGQIFSFIYQDVRKWQIAEIPKIFRMDAILSVHD